MQEMNFECTSRNKIALLLMFYALAAGTSGIFLYRLPDQYGRVKVMRIFAGINLLAQYTIILVPNYYVRLLGYAVLGFT